MALEDTRLYKSLAEAVTTPGAWGTVERALRTLYEAPPEVARRFIAGGFEARKVTDAFRWRETPQGYDFWEAVQRLERRKATELKEKEAYAKVYD